MDTTDYNEPPAPRKQSAAGTRYDRWITIPHAHCLWETEKALMCEFGDGFTHPVAKTQIAPRSAVRRRSDRGTLIITRYLAEQAGLMPFAMGQSRWALMPNASQVLKELNNKLPADDPAHAILKRIADALRKDLGIAREGTRGGDDGEREQGAAS